MENLPPKSPNMTAQNILRWPNFEPPTIPVEPNDLNNHSWDGDFVGFSTSKRRAHRRSISDVSMSFADEPTVNEGGKVNDQFEMRLEDDTKLIMSMLNNELKDAGPANSSSSTAAQKRRRREEKPIKAGEHQEAESLKCINNDVDNQPQRLKEWDVVAPPSTSPGSNEPLVDPKRVKRILANRQSAQRSRVRKLQYISELERSLNRLQTEVSMLSPRVAYLDHQRMMLSVDNTTLKSKIAALSHDNLFKDAHHEALKREIERLKQVFCQQGNVDTQTSTRLLLDL